MQSEPRIVQTLARLGEDASATSIAADAQGNVYVLAEAAGRRIPLMQNSNTNRVTQLPLIWNNILDIASIAVSPDGQELYMVDEGGCIFTYWPPWSNEPGGFLPNGMEIHGLSCYKPG
jgi:DNA-binding beta-propeller fold protein YncE